MLPMVANSVAICKNRADAMKGKSVVATVFISHASSCLRGWSGGYRVRRLPRRLVLTIQQRK